MLILAIAGTTLAEGKLRRYIPHSRHSRSVKASYPDRPLLEDEDGELPDPNRVRDLSELKAQLDSIAVASPMSWNPFLSLNTFSGYMTPPQPKLQYRFKPVYSVPDTTEQHACAVDSLPKLNRRLADAASLSRQAAWIQHKYMVDHPSSIEYALWLLPLPPEIPEDDISFQAYLRKMKLHTPNSAPEFLPQRKIDRIYWLHKFNGGIQFSQAFISKNWYQGGNDYLALLINFYWDVALNQAYYPNLLFNNTISYKLGLNSTKQDKYHNYSISEDLLQWNLNFGLKARKKWYYSLMAQFKTQILNNYPADSETRTAAFLSPSDLNVGLGMTYTTANRKNTLKFKAALSPVSYNLKTCIDPKVDPTQFNIKAGHKTHSEIGSSAELTLDWKITSNIGYRSRMFVFSDYRNYAHDWENTLSFAINRFLSTQVYWHLRYDTSSDASLTTWRHWMLKEILSFGFAYTFSTK